MDKPVSGIIELEAIIADLRGVADKYGDDLKAIIELGKVDYPGKSYPRPALPPYPGLIKYDKELRFCADRLARLREYIACIATSPILHVAL